HPLCRLRQYFNGRDVTAGWRYFSNCLRLWQPSRITVFGRCRFHRHLARREAARGIAEHIALWLAVDITKPDVQEHKLVQTHPSRAVYVLAAGSGARMNSMTKNTMH